MSAFDDILKKGKVSSSPPAGKHDHWRKLINTIVSSLNELQDHYDDHDKLSIQSNDIRCYSCAAKSFTLTVADLDDSDKTWRYKLPSWKTIRANSKDTFLCGNCKS